MFNSQKTIFTHFSRTYYKTNCLKVLEELVILGATIAPSSEVKILGVVPDQKLNYNVHVVQAS